MSEAIPLAEDVGQDDGDRRLLDLLDKLEADQMNFLDEAGKRVVELSTVMLGLLFAILALGDQFPPAWLVQQPLNQYLAVAALVLYLLALGAGVIAVQPRQYKGYRANLTRMRQEVERMIGHKRRWFVAGTWLLALASLCLAVLAALIILNS